MKVGNPEPELLTTKQFINWIREQSGLIYEPKTVIYWTRRDKNPLPIAYRGGKGQSNKYDLAVVGPWFKRERKRLEKSISDMDAASGNDRDSVGSTIDFHAARTIDMRERAKRSIVETGVITKKFCETAKVEREAEDLGRRAVQALLNISPRLSPRLAVMTDELEIDKLLQQELRAVCKQIMDLASEDDEPVSDDA